MQKTKYPQQRRKHLNKQDVDEEDEEEEEEEGKESEDDSEKEEEERIESESEEEEFSGEGEEDDTGFSEEEEDVKPFSQGSAQEELQRGRATKAQLGKKNTSWCLGSMPPRPT